MSIQQYRVTLWRTALSAIPEKEYPVEAESALEAAETAMKQHQAMIMGVVIVCSATKQETFYDVSLLYQGKISYDRFVESPRFSLLEPFDWQKPSDSYKMIDPLQTTCSRTTPEYLPPFTSEKPCPHCQELLHWSQNEMPPKVDYDTRTGFVYSVDLMRFCIVCGYKEVGFVDVDKAPVWTEIRD